MERAIPPADITPHDFFTRWIPEAVASDAQRRSRLAATTALIEFHLEGEGGGAYTLTIEAGTVTGIAGTTADPHLRVHVDIQTWRRLNAGEIHAPEALLKRHLKLSGDFLLGLKLHLILG